MAGFTGAPPIVTDGLVFAVDAANYESYPGSGTTWYDLSGNGNNGTLTNGVTFNSTDKTMGFDGSNDYVTIYNPISNNNNAWTPGGTVGSSILCYEIWVNTTDTNGRLISKPWNGSGNYNISIYPNVFTLRVDSSSTINLPAFNDGAWHQLIVWANSTTMGYYFDGLSNQSSVVHYIDSDTPTNGNTVLPLGIMTLYFYGSGWAGNTGHALSGDISIFRKYNRILSPQEVLQNYNALKGRFNL